MQTALAAPPVRLIEADLERLQHLLDHASPRIPGAAVLAQELARATVVGPRSRRTVPFARIGSLVEYLDLSSGHSRWVELVLPQDASIDDGRISVLTPIGAALIGLSPGADFEWPRPDGSLRAIRVLSVREPGAEPG